MDAKFFPEWEKMTVLDIREYIQQQQSVILPIGVIEQHGYHLPTSTDMIIARGLALRVGKKLGMLVAPSINTSFSGGELPGTINVHPNIMGLLVGEVLRSLAAQGFKNIFMIISHGGSENMLSLGNALKMLLRNDTLFEDVMLVLAPVWKFSSVWSAAFADRDWHAGWLETSLCLALAPELVQMDKLQLDTPEIMSQLRPHPDNYQYARKPIDHEFVVPWLGQRPDIQVGINGEPKKASREIGEKAVEEIVRKCCELFTKLETERTKDYKKVDWTPEPIIL